MKSINALSAQLPRAPRAMALHPWRLLGALVLVMAIPSVARPGEGRDYQVPVGIGQSTEGAGEGLWSDSCEYYNPKDRTDASITHPDVWNGKNLSGVPESSNEMYIDWFDGAHTQLRFMIPGHGVNRARSYGYISGHLYSIH